MASRRHHHRARATSIAACGLTLALLVTACGDDDDESAASTDLPASGDTSPATAPTTSDTPGTSDAPATTGSPDTTADPTDTTAAPGDGDGDATAFCDAALAAEATAMQGPAVDFETATPEEIDDAIADYAAALDPQLDDVVASAPSDIADDVEALVGLVRGGLETGEDVSTDPEYRAADENIDVYVAESCGYDVIEVSAVDYSFENLPSTLPAGRTAFAFTNDGEEIHEMVVFRINDDVTESLDELLALPEEEAFSKVEFAGVTFGAQGQTDTETFDLSPGRYAALCFVPVGTTDMSAMEGAGEGEGEPSGPPHFTAGMQAEFTVE